MCGAIEARRPRRIRRAISDARHGLTDEQEDRLIQCLTKQHLDNPSSPQAARDELIVNLLLKLGIRAGELLSLKVSDFNFQTNEVLIARRPDDDEDPRRYHPNAKTCDRLLPISNDLVRLLQSYILKHRRKSDAARRHPYLIISHRKGPVEGMPLSQNGLAKIFQRLSVCASLPGLTPHILRHTSNDRFSELMDLNRVGPVEEEKMRSFMMGWREGSGTAATYTRRHVRRKARDAAIKLQETIGVPKNTTPKKRAP
jgi:integrase